MVEATFAEYGERGSIDVLAWHPPTASVAVNEVKASIADAGTTLEGVDRKARLAPVIAGKLGWSCGSVSRLLVVADTTTSRRRIATRGTMFRAAFPLGGREVSAWIRQPSGAAVAGILFLPVARPWGTSRARGPVQRVRHDDASVGRDGTEGPGAPFEGPEPPPDPGEVS